MYKFLLLLFTVILSNNVSYAQIWNQLESGTNYDLRSIVFPENDQVGYVVGDGGTILKTNNGGATWDGQNSGTSAIIFEAHFFNNDRGIAIGNSNNILVTINGGENWSNISVAGTDETYFYRNIFFLDENTGFITGGKSLNEGVVLKTTNGGITWTSLKPGTIGAIYGISFTDNNIGYFSDFEGEIYKTINGGGSWSKLQSGATVTLVRLVFTSENVGYASGDKGTIIKTEDAGVTWKSINSTSDNYLAEIDFLDKNVGVAVGGNVTNNTSTIFRTNDGGKTWVIDETLTNRQNACFLVSLTSGYSCGNNGSILKTDAITADSKKINGELDNIILFPNPTDKYLNFDLGINSTKSLSVKITNSLGTVVFSDELNKKQSGIDLSLLGKSGVYFVEIMDNSNKSRVIKKVILN